jgi:diguanylate cyclase (GGDEF)-like protein
MMQDRLEQAEPASPARYWALAVLALGLALSAYSARWHHQTLVSERHQQWQRLADRSFANLADEVERAGQLVRAAQAVFLASDDVTPAELQVLHQGLSADRGFPALVALAYAERERMPGAFDRYVTRRVAPLAGNERILGLDVASQPPNLAALERSIRSNLPAMTAPLELLQFQGSQRRGVIIRLPVFAPGPAPASAGGRGVQAVGSLAASFDLELMIQAGLRPTTLTEFGIRVLDVSDGVEDLLHSSIPAQHPDQPVVDRFEHDLEFGGRVWRVQLDARPAALDLLGFPMMTLAFGLLASAMMALAMWLLIDTRGRAMSLAGRMTSRYQASETRFRELNELLPVVVALARVDDGGLEYLNQTGRRRFGLNLADAAGAGGPVLDQLIPDPKVVARIRTVASTGEAMLEQTVAMGTHGDFWASLSVSRIELDGRPHLLVVASDVTQLRELADRLRHQASHDELTGLFNRRGFDDAMESAIAAVDAGGAPAALLYLDLDQFKVINDSSGHAAGDDLLVQLAARLSAQLAPGDCLARLGGDEFGVLLADGREASARASAERLRRAISDLAYCRDGKTFPASASLGLVFIDRPGLSRHELLSMADSACFFAKERGRNRLHVFVEGDAESTGRRTEMEWVGRVRQAMDEHRLSLDYQRVVALAPPAAAHQGSHIELLLRMRDQHGVAIPPGDFIPAAERFGLMPQLDRWVIDTALANFGRLLPAGEELASCAINLSGTTVDDDQFTGFLLDAIARHAVPPERLVFEITETAAVGNLPRVQAFMQRLRAVGCRFALDDFGVGMASFGYLRQLTVDQIKIDGSFIRRIDSDPMSLSIVKAIVEIGHQADCLVVAEWVDSAELLVRLRGLGVDFAQGFHLHRPEPALFCRPLPA